MKTKKHKNVYLDNALWLKNNFFQMFRTALAVTRILRKKIAAGGTSIGSVRVTEIKFRNISARHPACVQSAALATHSVFGGDKICGSKNHDTNEGTQAHTHA